MTQTFDFTIVIFNTSVEENERIMTKLLDNGANDTTIAHQFHHTFVNFCRENDTLQKALMSSLDDLAKIDVTFVDAILIDRDGG